MILSSVRIAKSQKMNTSFIHNLLSEKNKINENENIVYEMNKYGQIRKENYKRGNESRELYKRQVEKFQKNIEIIKEDFQKHSYKGQKMRKDAHLFKEGVITFGKTGKTDYDKIIRELSKKEDFNRDVADGIQNVLNDFGIKGDITIYQHNDENSIHYHFDYLSYNFDTHKVINKEYSPKMLSKIQDTFSKSIEKHNIHRGIKKIDRKREYLEKNNINYEKLTPEQKKEVMKDMNIKNIPLKKYNQELQKNNQELQWKKEELITDNKKLLEEIKGMKKEKENEIVKLENIRQEIIKMDINKEQKKKMYEEIQKEKEKNRNEKKELDKMEKKYKYTSLSPENIQKIIKENSGLFKKDYQKMSKTFGIVVKNNVEKKIEEIEKGFSRTKEEKEYYERENNIKREVIGKKELKIEELKEENGKLYGVDREFKKYKEENKQKIEFFNKLTPEEIKEIEEYKKSQKKEGYKMVLKK